MHEAMIRVFYPLEKGRIVLRTEQDWEKDMEPCHVDRERHCFSFRFRHHRVHLSYKPCIRENGRLTWARGANRLALLHRNWPQDIYPVFFSGSGGTITDVIELPSRFYGHPRLLRVYLPAGYGENTMKRYPVLFMHDGKNLFFPQEAFLGQDWHMGENLELLNAMNLTEQVIIVGIYAGDREADYTSPGYHKYGACIVEEIKPWLDRTFRTLTGPWHTGVMGSSLGGVVSFFLAWNWPYSSPFPWPATANRHGPPVSIFRSRLSSEGYGELPCIT